MTAFMDEQVFIDPPEPREFRCPGQAYAIDRPAHLARLAAFYPGCLECEHRHQTEGLTPLQLRHRAAVERRAARGPRLEREGFAGTAGEEIDAAVVARAGEALAAALWRRRDTDAAPPSVLVGADGTWASADLVPAVCQALASGGCRAVEVGAVTSACLARAACTQSADAALWLGNASGEFRASGIKLWLGAQPASSPGDLDAVFGPHAVGAVRPKRRGGSLDRCDAAAVYLPTLAGFFHALRPLSFVLDSACEPLVRYWHLLAGESACRLLPTGGGVAHAPPAGESPLFERRRPGIAQSVLTAGAHFGAWIDGDGETLRLVDERGEPVDPERLLLAQYDYLCQLRPVETVALEPEAGDELAQALVARGARVERSGPTRQSLCQRMQSSGATVGGGPSGRFWSSGPPPAPDALLSLCLLVALLSQSDRPLSEVLDAAPAAG
jgi:phosphomannomutase